jgi:hypothetical protein
MCVCVYTQAEAYSVLHGMCSVAALIEGRSALHVSADGNPLPTPPSDEEVKAAVVALGCEEHLVTRHTAAVGVMLQKDPMDPAQVGCFTDLVRCCGFCCLSTIHHVVVHVCGLTYAAALPPSCFTRMLHIGA